MAFPLICWLCTFSILQTTKLYVFSQKLEILVLLRKPQFSVFLWFFREKTKIFFVRIFVKIYFRPNPTSDVPLQLILQEGRAAGLPPPSPVPTFSSEAVATFETINKLEKVLLTGKMYIVLIRRKPEKDDD
jgi:hypothetical protein